MIHRQAVRRAALGAAGMSAAALILLGILVMAGPGVSPVGAQGGDLELPPGVTLDEVMAVASKLHCIVCEAPGVSLDKCDSVACRQWQQEIAQQLGEGRTEDEIIDLFVVRYGVDIVITPTPVVTFDDVNAIARKMYCDVCEGVPLDECESIACRQWRDEIARLLGEGRTEDEILDIFVERYGADVASLPRSTGDRVLAYAVPIFLALAVAVIGGMQVQQMRRRGQQAGQVMRRSAERLSARPVPGEVDPAYLERLQAELGELDT